MIPDMTIGQLYNEAESRWGEIWDENAVRLMVLLIFPRKQRKLMELHGDMIEHGQPVMTVFHRPRAEASLPKTKDLIQSSLISIRRYSEFRFRTLDATIGCTRKVVAQYR